MPNHWLCLTYFFFAITPLNLLIRQEYVHKFKNNFRMVFTSQCTGQLAFPQSKLPSTHHPACLALQLREQFSQGTNRKSFLCSNHLCAITHCQFQNNDNTRPQIYLLCNGAKYFLKNHSYFYVWVFSRDIYEKFTLLKRNNQSIFRENVVAQKF